VTPSFSYTRQAENELREILRYTTRKWGPAQARAYARKIEQTATALATGRGVFREWDDLLPGLRVKSAGSHFVFCVARENQPALVLAILHERMDLIERLKERLR